MTQSMTPFQRHKARVEKKLAIEQQREQLKAKDIDTAQATVIDYSQFEVLKASLEQDLKTLSGIQNGDAKDAKRRELVERYAPAVRAYLESSDDPYANPVLVQQMIWHFDLGQLPEALTLAEVAISESQKMPEQFDRNVPTFAADSALNILQKEIDAGNSPEPYLTDIFTQLQAWDVPNVVRMKYAKTLGHCAFDGERWAEAITYYKAAKDFEMGKFKAQVDTKLNKALANLEKQQAVTKSEGNDA